jgi:hypothetical protein
VLDEVVQLNSIGAVEREPFVINCPFFTRVEFIFVPKGRETFSEKKLSRTKRGGWEGSVSSMPRFSRGRGMQGGLEEFLKD